jgi:hypothetical protein
MTPPAPRMAVFQEACVLALWLGASLFFAVWVAPTAFDVLPDAGLAGALVGRLLPPLFLAGAICGLAVLAAEHRWRRPGRGVRSGGAVIMIAACGLAQFVLGARIARVRAAVDRPIAQLAPDDARRREFGRLHGMSVASLGAAMLGATLVIVSAARELRGAGGERGA